MKLPARLRLAIAAALVCLMLAVGLGATRYFAATGPVPSGTPTSAPASPGWIALLDETNAHRWRNITDDKDIVRIQDGALHIPGRSLHPLRYAAFTGQTFQDFELHVEFKLARRANSGLFLRAPSDKPDARGFEIQVIDDYGKPPTKHGSGAVYDVVTPMFNLSRPAGEWNSFDIRLEGPDLEVKMNGWLVVKTDLGRMTEPYGKFKVPYADLPREGRIMIQDHGGEAWYRNLLVRPIPSPQPVSPPRS